jgi:hypothetical protein
MAKQPFLSHSLPYKFLPGLPIPSWSRPSSFTSLDFATVTFLQSKFVSLAPNPQTGGPGLCTYVPQWRVTQLGTRYDSQDRGGGIVTHLHAGSIKIGKINFHSTLWEHWSSYFVPSFVLWYTQPNSFPSKYLNGSAWNTFAGETIRF